MCFSATGSFAASGALTLIGIASLRRNERPAQRMFAAVPLLFAAQQAAEGAVWLTIHDRPPSAFASLAMVAFLGFALVVWPLWLPVSLRLIEPDPRRRRALSALSGMGLLFGGIVTILLLRWRPGAHVTGHSIGYEFDTGVRGGLGALPLVGYLIPTIVPFFVSTVRLARVMGAVLVVSLILTLVAERNALTSVWCFFAAILSGLVWEIVGRARPVARPVADYR